MKHHNSANEYIQDMIGSMKEVNELEPMVDELFEYWCEEITLKCNERYQQYTNDQIESYKLSEQDVSKALQDANSKLVGDTLASLVEQGMVKMSVGDDGEIYYEATDKGNEHLKK